jgi:hypothetical protein
MLATSPGEAGLILLTGLIFACMKGISIIHDETRKKRYVQIDMELIKNDRELLEDYLDALLIESRKEEPSIPLDKFGERMKKAPR